MTVLGKTLVIINLVFSLVTAALIIMVFAARTNWKVAYDKATANVKVAQANAVAYMNDADEVRKQLVNDHRKLSNDLAQAIKERDRAAQEAKDLVVKLQEADKLHRTANVGVDTTTAELDRRRNENEKLKELMATLQQQNLELEKEKKAFRDRAIAAELAAKSEQDRNQNLLGQLEVFHREKQQPAATANGARTPGSDKAPPPEDVEGVVLEADPQTGYLVLSIGSDAGLARGNTLEAYRLKPEPRYLGTVQILEVRPHQSVAKAMGPRRGNQILSGDRVASNILSKR